MTVAKTARMLAERGLYVFPLNLEGTPRTADGFKSASIDPFYVEEVFEKYGDKARIGIATGMSGLVVLDLDYKEDAEGNVLVDGYDSLDRAWVDVVDSYSYTSAGGNGKHIWYRAPEGKNLPRKIGYRKMKGVDRCSGEGYVNFNGTDLPDMNALAEAPEWLCDETSAREESRYEGTVKEWYDSLEEGEPSLIVRKAIERANKVFTDNGNDFSHSDIVERQHEAVKLGSEGHPGVPELLAHLEDLMMSRTGAHSRPEEEWQHEFQEALVSGIEKHGAAIQLRRDLPPFSLATAPAGIPDRLLVGEPGDKPVFTELLRALLAASDDDLYVTSALWNSARTKDLAREWGIQFVHDRVLAARAKPEPVRENPTLPDRSTKPDVPHKTEHLESAPSENFFMTPEEMKRATENKTFIDDYLAASATKGYWNRAYDMPAAWTCLSMGLALRAVIPKGVALGTNLWFHTLGESGTGKTAATAFARHVLNNMLRDGEGYWNTGAMSSPEGLLVELLTRDGKPSMIFQDESSSFFSSLKSKDWMKSLEYELADYYMGDVGPSNKLSLKDLRGKSARTSFNMYQIATPERLLSLINTDMFETGFMARYNWTIADEPVEDDRQYEASRSETNDEKNAPSVTFDLAADLLHARAQFRGVVQVWGTDAAVARLMKAHKDFDHAAKHHEKYQSIRPSITRLARETMWKCATLLALYEGRTTFTEDDVLTALMYGQEWFENLIRVVEATSESEFAGDVTEIEQWIKAKGGKVSAEAVLHRFRNMIRYSPRELEDRLQFLVSSGRLLREEKERRVMYELNGAE